MTKRQDESALDASIRIDHLPPEGRDLKLSANAEQRAALAERLTITSVEKLDVTLNAAPFRGGIRVLGRLIATIVQPCVVTFAPVTQDIDEPIDRVFLPGREKQHTPGAEVFIDIEEEDAPDYFEGPEVDLTELIVETLSLAIDPYPRAPGASLADIPREPADEPESPFSSLKSLRDKGDKS
ncbi:metal-binding protein [Youhaiella tibetensis]|uniref:DUF177 domain-containing protein n=1 Tax=Paradevosia tibetensis TaxID=1447062 RepID=A0A5B9DMP5_9HYPH|nr:DUF177 domain-containing protein [Youhaiella tibetensis]QEE20373.1 DUF177 domain-containing protein [Youhaiella tibetensis]GGF24755.1 metal-binding protein [Youhaiella tibetensis]